MAVRQIEVPARLARRLSPASFVLAGVTVFLLWVAVTGLLRQGSLGTVLLAGWAELAAPLLVGLVVVTGVCERIWPAEPRPVLARGHVQDACFLALHAIVVIPLMTLLSVGAATLIGGHAQWIELRPSQNWPGWLLVPLTIVAMDAANWLAHYADHRFDALWRFHALHHSQEELSVLTSFRAHPLMHTTGFLLASIPVVVLMPARPIDPVAHHRLRLRRHPAARQPPLDLRPARPGPGEPRVPPAAPRDGHPGREPRRRADDLGCPGRPGEVPLARQPRRPHRPGRPPGPRRAGRPGSAAPAAHGRPAHRAFPSPALTLT